MKLLIIYYVNGLQSFSHQLDFKKGHTCFLDLPLDQSRTLNHHQISIQEVKKDGKYCESNVG